MSKSKDELSISKVMAMVFIPTIDFISIRNSSYIKGFKENRIDECNYNSIGRTVDSTNK